MRTAPLYIFITLCILFSLYSFSVYFKPGTRQAVNEEHVAEGRLVWQKFNCQACHQLYGLGGYIGPDLTNVVSPEKNDTYIKAIVSSGSGLMPAFEMTVAEQEALLAFLKSCDASGSADPRDFNASYWGMTERK